MNFNIHSLNFIIRQAISEQIEKHVPSQWPKHYFDFEPIIDIPDFRAFRKHLKEQQDDPLNY